MLKFNYSKAFGGGASNLGSFIDVKSHIKNGFTLTEIFSRHSLGQRRHAAQIIRCVGKSWFPDILRTGFAGIHTASCRNLGFTLAEVLITLGIIGIVAAMTLPNLIQTHTNLVVEARLKKFYSIFNQAIEQAEVKHGDRKYWYEDTSGVDLDEDGNPIEGTARIDIWYEKYLSEFIVLKKKVTVDGYVIYYLPDGSAFQLGTDNLTKSLRDIIFYTGNPEKCEALARKDGICRFLFEYMPLETTDIGWKYITGKGLEPYKYNWDGTRNGLLNGGYSGCNSTKTSYCTALIQYDGWKISKDYPFKVRYF